MATVTINEKTSEGKKLVAFLKTLDYVTFQEKIPTESLKRAMNEAKTGKVNSYKNSEELFARLRKKADV